VVAQVHRDHIEVPGITPRQTAPVAQRPEKAVDDDQRRATTLPLVMEQSLIHVLSRGPDPE